MQSCSGRPTIISFEINQTEPEYMNIQPLPSPLLQYVNWYTMARTMGSFVEKSCLILIFHLVERC